MFFLLQYGVCFQHATQLYNIYICTYIHALYIYTCIHICIYICTYIYTYIYILIYKIFTYMYIYICIYLYMCLYWMCRVSIFLCWWFFIYLSGGLEHAGSITHLRYPASIPSGKHTKNYGKSPFIIGKSTINDHFQYLYQITRG
jgi:hypothetical protein